MGVVGCIAYATLLIRSRRGGEVRASNATALDFASVRCAFGRGASKPYLTRTCRGNVVAYHLPCPAKAVLPCLHTAATALPCRPLPPLP